MHCLILLALLAPPAIAQLSAINDAVGDFSFALLKPTLKGNANTIHSAYSIWTALGMCLVGAQGQTLENMKKYMYIQDTKLEDIKSGVKESTRRIEVAQPESKVRFTAAVANRIYVNESYPLGADYVNTVSSVFGADAKSVNFRADSAAIRSEINKFVANTTHDLIPSLLDDPLEKKTLIALINALYFKGSWAKVMKLKNFSGKFNAHINGGQAATWMGLTDRFAYGHNSDLEATLIELPYASRIDSTNPEATDTASMVILLPDKQHNCQFRSWVEEKLTWSAITKAIKSSSPARVNLTMPKFNVESSFELSGVLESLGMSVPFSDSANFNGMVASGAARLKISKVIHKAKMMVDEKGTTAAAATAVFGIRTLAIMVEEPEDLTIDRSFVAIIILRQDNKSIVPLFTAVVNKLS